MKKILMILIPALLIVAGCQKQETSSGANAFNDETEQFRKALLELYEATDGPYWSDQPNWALAPVLEQFDNVTIDEYGESVELDLERCNLHGELPRSLFELPWTKICLSDNYLYGELPDNVGKNGLLDAADFSDNNLTGTLPVSLKECPICQLNVSGNRMSGKIPDSVMESLDLDFCVFDPQQDGYELEFPKYSSFNESDSLTLMNIYNAFPDGVRSHLRWDPGKPYYWKGVTWNSTGRCIGIDWSTIPLETLPEQINELTALRELSLDNCSLRSLPSLDKLKQLQFLSLSDNKLSTIPDFIGEFTALRELNLGSNTICGPIPAFLNNLTELVSLQICDNKFSGKIPDLNQLRKLRILDLSAQQRLELQDFPDWIGNNTGLQYLDCCYTNLSGNITSVLEKLVNLRTISLHHSKTYGDISTCLKNMKNLISFDVENCSNSGKLPEFHPQCRIHYLDLTSNHFNGEIPESWENLICLEKLYLEDNFLTGTIPASFRKLTNLSSFNCSENFMSGYLSEELRYNPYFDSWVINPQFNSDGLKFPEPTPDPDNSDGNASTTAASGTASGVASTSGTAAVTASGVASRSAVRASRSGSAVYVKDQALKAELRQKIKADVLKDIKAEIRREVALEK